MWALLFGVLPLVLSGCVVTAYQPLVALQRPTVVDPQALNFEGLRLLVRCLPEEPPALGLSREDADLLCQRVTKLFRTQGAEVDTEVPRPGVGPRLGEGDSRPELVMELRGRRLHPRNDSLLTAFSIVTLTLVPAITEHNYAQEVVIREPGGYQLVSESLQARFIEYAGVGVWGVNWAVDTLARPPSERVTGDVAKEDFSRDMYAQLSQLLFNARVRSRVLRGLEAGR